ncbi:MAG: Zn-dependent protease with chaperone function [Veillonella sp.]|nr:Zn-dependent protease with chaperone function [Veillonella sp.]
MKPEFVPWLWIIYVDYVLYKRYKENSHLEKYEIIFAIISLLIVSGGFLLLTFSNLTADSQLIINILIAIVLLVMKTLYGV